MTGVVHYREETVILVNDIFAVPTVKMLAITALGRMGCGDIIRIVDGIT
jgi:hypothetical protein